MARSKANKQKDRIPINDIAAAQILVASDNTCCKCEERLSPIQMHHIDEDPSNNEPSNLAVLCLSCHNATQVRGGFGRQLSASSVRLYRDQWIERVTKRREDADAAFLARASRGSAVEKDSVQLGSGVSIQPPLSLPAYIETMPEVLAIAYRRVKETWCGSTLETVRSAYDVTEVLKLMWLHLAGTFPPGHFAGLPPAEYLEIFLERQYAWQAALAEPCGIGTGGTIAGTLVARGVLQDVEKVVVQLRDAIAGLSEKSTDRASWLIRWNAAHQYLDGVADGVDVARAAERLNWLNPQIFTFMTRGETIEISARHLGNAGDGTAYALFKRRVGGEEFFFEIIKGHHLEFQIADLDGDGIEELIVLYHCGAHNQGMNIYALNDVRDLPKLIPGGSLCSDWPAFSWEANTTGQGSLLTKKDRDWDNSPASNYVIRQFLIALGECRPLDES